MTVTVPDAELNASFNAMIGAVVEHAAAQPAGVNFSDIQEGLNMIRRFLAMPLAPSPTTLEDIAKLREVVGMPPLSAPASVPNWQPLSGAAMDDVWARSAPPLPPFREAIRQSMPFLDNPHWQRIAGLHGAHRWMGESMRRAVGPAWGAFLADARTQGFLTTVGLRVTQAIAQSAGSLHDSLAVTAANNQARTALKNLAAAANATAKQVSTTAPTASSTPATAPAPGPAASTSPATESRAQAARLKPSTAKAATPRQQGAGRRGSASVVPPPQRGARR
ncbi:hypothetical protein OG339_48525 (plasmid) [Streptosporangium sp. NBC_01495]|uniref:hypothetical protein n=1 Tax=Streptosporangium sp. NBC_01495 TaxID=2903899 RepID=UPI002E367A99|nr:hypothetical protein [Streptosporangium sp. NBC_01495]